MCRAQTCNVIRAHCRMQAFHWFANEDSLKEIYRVLKPSGAFIMFANREDDRDPWARAILCCFEPYSRVGQLTAAAHECLLVSLAAHLFVKLRVADESLQKYASIP